MKLDDIRLAEHFAFATEVGLFGICDALRTGLELPDFAFDSENETAWGAVTHDGIEYNVSKPYVEDTLREWDESVPEGCNVGVTISVSVSRAEPRDAEQSLARLVPHIGQALANCLARAVHHHRTWLRPGENVMRSAVFQPAAAAAAKDR